MFEQLGRALEKILLFSFGGALFLVTLLEGANVVTEQQFSLLATSFLQGKTYLTMLPGTWGDTVLWNGNFYWTLSPLPAVMAMPIEIWQGIWTGWGQRIVHMAAVFICIFLLWRMVRRRGYAYRDAGWMVLAFFFGSLAWPIIIIPWGWYTVHVLTVMFLFLALSEYTAVRRWGYIGIWMALAFGLRATAGIVAGFFVLELLRGTLPWREKLKAGLLLMVPMVIMGLLLLGYNQMRFGNPFMNGYKDINNCCMSEQERYEVLHYGLFQLRNIPTNFYYYFLKSFDPVLVPVESFFGPTHILQSPYLTVKSPGLSFFVSSPVFLYLFAVKRKVPWLRSAWITIGVIVAVLLTYYWPGWRQVGPRYFLDFLPIAFMILLEAFPSRRVPVMFKILVMVGIAINLLVFDEVF